ncbi:MAG: SDR family oxidoreductase [Mycobacteriaceae bacterium]|nr:SDR family oxidoreductase [Mycobacteriaceae bacterium]
MDTAQLRDLFDLSGRTAIITGGTRGIGLALARGHLAAGANVVVASRSEENCAAVEKMLDAEAPGRVAAVPTHVGDLDQLKHLVAQTVSKFGGIDIVVNNAANALAQPLGEMTPQAWDKSTTVNVRGPLFLVQEALPYLEASPHAVVLNVVSVGAFMFSPETTMYSAGKAALMSLTRSMAATFANRGIRVNALAPGGVNTDMMRANPQEFIDMLANASFLRRLAEPEEMVGPALLLTSDAGSFITGQVLIADGGLVPR